MATSLTMNLAAKRTLTILTGAFGSTGKAIVDASGAFSQSIINNNFRVLEDQLNEIRVILTERGVCV